MMSNTFEAIRDAADGLKSFLPKGFEPYIGIICGSGLSGIAEAIEAIDGGVRDEISYSEIKGFPISTGEILYFK
jgi:purine nucleoside phosphorylase